jgi:hypothetical protein
VGAESAEDTAASSVEDSSVSLVAKPRAQTSGDSTSSSTSSRCHRHLGRGPGQHRAEHVLSHLLRPWQAGPPRSASPIAALPWPHSTRPRHPPQQKRRRWRWGPGSRTPAPDVRAVFSKPPTASFTSHPNRRLRPSAEPTSSSPPEPPMFSVPHPSSLGSEPALLGASTSQSRRRSPCPLRGGGAGGPCTND